MKKEKRSGLVLAAGIFAVLLLMLISGSTIRKAYADNNLLATVPDGIIVKEGITRAEWMHNLVLLYDMNLTEEEYPDLYFPDIQEGSEYYDAIMIATKYGVLDIEAGDPFEPEKILTREFAAHTLNCYLGRQPSETHSFADADQITYLKDAEAAVELNWFALINGAFVPEEPVTSAEITVMLNTVQETLDGRKIEERISRYEFADYVKVLPETVSVDTEFDLNTDDVFVTVSGWGGTLKAGDTFAFTAEDFAFVYSVESVSFDNGVYTVLTKDAPEDAVKDFSFAGEINPELTPELPEKNEPIILKDTEGQTVYIGPLEIDEPSAVNSREVKNSISFSRKIEYAGVTGKLQGKADKLRLESKFIGDHRYFKLLGTLELSSSIEINFLSDKDVEIDLGVLKVGPFAKIGFVLKLDVKAKISYKYSADFEAGIECTDKKFDVIRKFNARGASLTAEGTVSAELAFTAKLEFGVVGEAEATLQGGPVVKAKQIEYFEGTPKKCVNIEGYLHAALKLKAKLKLFVDITLEREYVFYDEKHTPIYVGEHREDGVTVHACTREKDVSAGIADEGYAPPKYVSPSNSRYYSSGNSNGSSTGWGSAGQPIVIWDTEENEEGGLTITGYHGSASFLTIPATIDGQIVTAIGNNVFEGNTTLQTVTVSNGIVSIGRSAFKGCTNMYQISLPDSVTRIEGRAFESTGLTSLTLPSNISYLGGGILVNNTGVKEVTIPKTLIEVEHYSGWMHNFDGESIYSDNGVFGLSAISKVTFEQGTTEILPWITARMYHLTEVNIPDTVTEIGEYAFFTCNALTEINIPNSVTAINQFVFKASGLQSLELPSNIRRIGCGILEDNTGVKEIVVPKTLTGAGHYSAWMDDFDGESIYSESGVFGHSAINKITFEEGTTEILPWITARMYHLTEVNIPDTVIEIGERAFLACNVLAEINIPNSVTEIGVGAFSSSGLKVVTIPDSVGSMDTDIFSGCVSLTEIKLPSSRINLPASTFEGCISLERIELPETVKYIRRAAFKNCSALKEIIWSKAPLLFEESAFENCDAFTEFIIPDTVETIENRVFYDCDGLTSATIPSHVKHIGEYAFNDCDALASVTVADSVEEIGDYIFYDCDALTTVSLGTGVTIIPDSAFEHCDVLASIDLPYRITSIGSNAFKDCIAFREIFIPRSVTTIKASSFSYYDKLTIYGVRGTYAETYANENRIRFVDRSIPATGVTLDKTSLELVAGNSYTLRMTVTPENFTDLVTWKSSNTNVVTVSDRGVVEAVGIGTTTVKLTVGSVSASCRVTVVQPVTWIDLDYDNYELEALDTMQITAYVYPEDAYETSVTWSSSDPEIVSVDQNGLVTAHKKGSAEITAAANDGSGVQGSCEIEVINNAHIASAVEDLESPHNYPNNFGDFWVYTLAGAKELSVTFDSRTNIEEGFDYLYIYDGERNQIGGYTGTGLAGQTIKVPGNTVRIKLVSDEDGNEWGFKVTAIEKSGEITNAGWQKNSKGWWYRRADGTYPKNQWEKIDGKWYHFDASGYMQTGWQQIGGKWYYLGTSGAMATGWKQISGTWYYLGTSGVMVTGWNQISGKWYYFSSSGAMQTGWKQISGVWYYLDTSGAMATGWKAIDGKTYYFKENGAMAAKEWVSGWWLNADGTWTYKYRASWKKNSTGWWYGDTSGWYAKNCTIKIDGKNYTFDAKGYMK